ncbi:MAG: Asp-tRNA(Asn)/Glu-tRNA(Gln) amidotransferase subunit GatA [bacterium]|nr:Asp-tRNA(Asn)/Glu-tRNA(Gln) amidotransferase subunit GatA [bacterium]
MELCEYTCWQLHDMLKRKEVSSREITESVIKRIEEVDERTNCYITKTFDVALQKSHQVDDKIRRGEEIHPLSGIPIAIKDNICTEGVRTTCGSRILLNFIPPYDATVVKRLKEKGAVFIGKTNMDEFAMGSSTETSYFGITRNPWNLETVPGGSSGGSAAAVAADQTILALGSDTGGSIRQPASMCGVIGLKPTYGRISRFGLIAYASSLDQIGPITKDVRDCTLLLNAISGYDEQDSTSVNREVPDYTKSLVEDLKGIKIGIPTEYFGKGLDKEVEEGVLDGVKLLCSLGAEAEETHLPHTDYAIASYYLIATSEASSNLARYDGVGYGYRGAEEDLIDMYKHTRSSGFGAEVKRRIMLGTYSLSSGYYDAYYLKALKVRTLIKQDFEEAFKKFDCLITPTSPTPAFYIGEKIDDPLTMYLQDIYTISTNLAGIPGISIPCGFSHDGLPIGLQILGPIFGEEKLLQIAYTFEQNTDYHQQKPKI